MRIKILGSAAGGGFPQWNCACPNCRRLRDGSLRGRSRTQTQLAVTSDNQSWYLIGASPDLRQQIVSCLELAPETGTPSSPITAVFLPSADVDAVMGLLHLREFQAFLVFATPAVQQILKEENHIFRVLERAKPPVAWFSLPFPGQPGRAGANDLRFNAVPTGGEFPDYVSDELRGTLPAEQSVVGFILEQSGKRAFIAPSLSGRRPEWKTWAESSDLVLIDGTFWSDDELIHTGRSKKTARQIGHIPLSGPDGLLAQYPKSARGRKVLLHINNTNPILDEESAEHRAVLDAGFEIAYDGMEFDL
jgi:pyrroloquinoline quinone biosynthesis protein B